jgi:hypothetical protein
VEVKFNIVVSGGFVVSEDSDKGLDTIYQCYGRLLAQNLVNLFNVLLGYQRDKLSKFGFHSGNILAELVLGTLMLIDSIVEIFQ